MTLAVATVLLGAASSAHAARPIFSLDRELPASGVAALRDGSIVGTQAATDWHKARTWRLTPTGHLQNLSRHARSTSPRGGNDIEEDADGTLFITTRDSLRRLSDDGQFEPVATGLVGANGLAATRDGAFLVAEIERHRIVRVERTGTVTPVAGTGQPGFSGDGGPATEARVAFPWDVSATPDGGFLIAEYANRRVRKVFPDGTIRTVAGNGRLGVPRDGAPATATPLGPVQEVVAGRHGGFLFLSGTVNRVTGTVNRVTRDGVLRRVAGGTPDYASVDGLGVYNGDGGDARRARVGDVEAMDITPHDDYLLATRDDAPDTGRLRWVLAQRTPRLEVAARTLLPVRRRLSYISTRPATVQLLLRSRRHRLVLEQEVGPNRHGFFRFPRTLPPGAYFVRLRATSADGQSSTQSLGMIYARKLTMPVVRLVLRADEASAPLITARGLNTRRIFEGSRGMKIGPCRRMSRFRVDCKTRLPSVGGRCVANSVVLFDRRLGQLGQIGYDFDDCGPFRRGASLSGASLVGLLDEEISGARFFGLPPRR